MTTKNQIGLDSTLATGLIEQLNVLLANYSIFYQNVRGFHWNIKGEKFFELHLKFEELYNDIQLKMDEIAERILTLGGSPEHRYSVYATIATIKETNEVENGVNSVKNILASFKQIITLQRAVLNLASEADDEGTNSLMSDYISAQEKLVWMYTAFIG